ncbi:MEDS domain-containing protein [Bacillus sp. T33-2]|uniref:MEDS domain-containing protein n=1 Tax=Bacillus sp. T33-2 TaxID=2054168 RepID=UPI0021552939|nr:MEDS domain-containing protein [Bacillus sp. T33-2]
MKEKFSQLIKENKHVHITYYITETESYLNNLISYILSGVEENHHILVIQSERLIPQLYSKLEKVLTKDQIAQVHTINNFDYNMSTGSFQPDTIFENLTKIVAPFYEKNISFRTWAHVEWGQQEEIYKILEELENKADRLSLNKNYA